MLTGEVAALILIQKFLSAGGGMAGVTGENYQEIKNLSIPPSCSTKTCECWKEAEVDCTREKCKGGKCFPRGVSPGINWKMEGWCNK